MALGNAAVATIDSAFIQSEEHRPRHAYTYYDRVPVIDLSPLQSQSYSDIHAAKKSLEELVMEVGKACKEWGFFVVINHGVPTDVIRKVRSAAAEFYALPLKEKRKVRRDEQNPLGYFDNELTENVRDWREVFTFVSGEKVELSANSDPLSNDIHTFHNKWPQNPPQLSVDTNLFPVTTDATDNKLCSFLPRLTLLSLAPLSPPPDTALSADAPSLDGLLSLFFKIFSPSPFFHRRGACESYAEVVEKLSFRLLELISLSLGLEARRMNEYFSGSTSFVRLNYYPACPAPELALGVGRHKDGGGLTVLFQDEIGGLEVKRKDGEWVGVEPLADSFVINVGDCMQVWSNERYHSVEHRAVVNERRARFSIPFFFNPSHTVMIKPLDELVSEEDPPKYREYNWGKFFKARKDSNYKDLGVENLQIHHFRTTHP
eukprot:Gb_00277 [translate_table: standard]